MSKVFKVGGKAKVVKKIPQPRFGWNHLMDDCVGKEFEIESLTKELLDGNLVFIITLKCGENTWRFMEECLEPVVEKHQYAVGDKVKVVREYNTPSVFWTPFWEERLGQEFVVDKVDNEDNTLFLKVNDNTSGAWINMESVDPASIEYFFIDDEQVSEKVFKRRTQPTVKIPKSEYLRLTRELGIDVKLAD